MKPCALSNLQNVQPPSMATEKGNKEDKMQKIKELVIFFETNRKKIKSNWNETETRIELINPLFECLGWDVNNKQKLADPFKEVKHEASLKIGSNMKAPDYSFNYGRPLFYLEAKKPSVDLKQDISPAFQLRRYGWTAKMPISILTDFEELAIYDCRIKPNKNDNTGIARLKYYTYTDYIDKWDEIYNFISKEAILHGSLNDFENKQIKGTASIDDDFLAAIESWRKSLTLNIALRNEINENELNFAVQLIIDRILFLRICEDRGIENYEILKSLTNNNNIYENLLHVFNKADDKYNSGLFHFKVEKDRIETPDNITPKLKIDDKILKDIIKDLYYPDCPYELSVISSDVLGSVYERFLGKIITLKENSKRATIDFKPEVRKSGGVYYTPDYIVEYIVKNTIGENIKNKTPNQVSNIRILDPACGSGSFIIEAYQYLLDWHLNYYINNDPEKWKKGKNLKIFESKTGLQLTLSERKKILINNIYGVDIDKNAVEVTKLSLLLKVLEYEGQEVHQNELFQERILPDLYKNIKCGNSLIGTDILNDNINIDILKLNPFDWNNEFKEIIDNGGFDCIIGNPPYISQKGSSQSFLPFQIGIWKKYYERKSDMYYFFYIKATQILKSNGFLGFITPQYWLTSFSGSKVRAYLSKNIKLISIFDTTKMKVFNQVSIDCMVFIFCKNKHNDITIIEKKGLKYESYKSGIKNNNLNEKEWYLFKKSNYIDLKTKNNTKPLFNIAEIIPGIQTGGDSISLNHIKKYSYDVKKKGNGIYVLTIDELKKLNLSNEEMNYVKPIIKNSEIERYYLNRQQNKYLILANLINDINKTNKIKEHLQQFKKILKGRKRNYALEKADKEKKWWFFHTYRPSVNFEEQKIILPYRANIPKFAFNDYSIYGLTDVYFLNIKDTAYSYKYLLSILNSQVIRYFLNIECKKKGNIIEFSIEPLKNIPIPKPSIQIHDKLHNLVDQMHTIQKKYHSTSTDHEKKLFEQQIKSIDNQIDNLVYELYGLNEDETKIIEDSLKIW